LFWICAYYAEAQFSAEIFSLFIALIMVSSIASYMFFGTNMQKAQEEKIEEKPKIEQPKIEIYNADVEAEIVELFPSVFLVAKTTEAEKSVVDKEVTSLARMSKFNSYYVQEQQQPKIMQSLTYAANIVLEEDENLDKFVQRVRELDIFNSVELYRIVLAKLPTEIVYIKEEDENVTRKHSLEEPFANIYADPNTIKGDKVRVSLKAYFADGQLFKQIGFEIENLSAKPKFLSKEAHAKILELYNRLNIVAQGSYKQKRYNEIENKLRSLEFVENMKYFMQPISYRIYVDFEDRNFLKERMQDINKALLKEDLNFKISAYSLKINFDENSNYENLKEKINNALEDFNVKYSLDEPRVYINADMNTSKVDNNVISEIQKLIFAYDLNLNMKRFALLELDINKLIDEKSKEEFLLNKKQNGLVNIERTIGEDINVEIQAIGVRDKLEYIEVKESS